MGSMSASDADVNISPPVISARAMGPIIQLPLSLGSGCGSAARKRNVRKRPLVSIGMCRTARNGVFSLLFLLLNVVSTGEVPATVFPEMLPMRIGDRWVYEEEILGGDRRHPDVNRWEQEDRTVAIQVIPEGVLVKRTVRFLENTAPPRYLGIRSESNILIHKSCIYYLNDSPLGYGYGWDSSRHELSSGFRKDLVTNQALPDVCFPLRIGQTWGNPNQGRDLWTVAGLGRKHPDDPASVTKESWRLEANLSSGDDNYVWFQKGIGIVAKRTYHKGTYDDQRVRLLRFQPASPLRRASEFSQVPRQFARELDQRGCLIPDDSPLSSNVMRGQFARAGHFDWAALCSTRADVSLLVFWSVSGKTEELTRAPDRTRGRDVYLRTVGKEFIMDHYRAYGGPKPPPIDHEGIEYGGEHVSTVCYFYRGKWIFLQGAD